MKRLFKPTYDEWIQDQFKQDPKDKELVYKFSRFLRPGQHFFFFIQGGKYFMLSKKFLIEKFKDSNFCMNTFTVPPAFLGWRIPYEFTEDLHVDSIEE